MDSVGVDDFLIEEFPPRVLGRDDLDLLLGNMVDSGGSDIFIMSNSQVWMSVYGRKRRLTRRKLGHGEVMTLLESFYGETAKAELGKGRQIDDSCELRRGRNDRYRFRVNAVGCIRDGADAVTITMRSIPTDPPSAREMGVESEILDICDITDQGLILVVGATGNGKSTTMAGILRDQMEREDSNRNFVTVESPVEFVYDGVEKPSSFVTQIEVGKHLKSFGEGVINALRMAPNVILIGESRDYETVSASVEASRTGHAVYSTVHSNSVAETIRRLVAVYPDDLQSFAQFDIVDSSTMYVAQRLVPSTDGKRVALREYLIFDSDVKDRLRTADNIVRETYRAVEEFGRPMIEDAQKKLDEGRITEDVFRRIEANYQAQ